MNNNGENCVKIPSIIKLKNKLIKLNILIIFLINWNTGNLFKYSKDSLIILNDIKKDRIEDLIQLWICKIQINGVNLLKIELTVFNIFIKKLIKPPSLFILIDSIF